MRLSRLQGLRSFRRPLDTEVFESPDVASLAVAHLRDGALDDEVSRIAASYALDGESLQTLLDDLDRSFEAITVSPPDGTLVKALALAWSDAFLGRYSRLTCVDPLTGLATRQHLQTHVATLYSPEAAGDWAVIVIDTESPRRLSPGLDASVHLGEALDLTVLAGAIDVELVAGELLVSLTSTRCAILARRDARLSDLVIRVEARARESRQSDAGRTRVWVERLPATAAGAATMIDELCR